METRECKSCKGTGVRVQEAFYSEYSKTHYPRRESPCYTCAGAKFMPQPDFKAIIAAIKGRKGGLRSARPKDHRAYYVWRMARFHGGADVTMPMNASLEIHGDPFQPELEAFADIVAKRVFGSNLAAAHRWGRALGYLNTDLPGLPDSAYPGGRVADSNKPLDELAELY